jgi:hypothetical protein
MEWMIGKVGTVYRKNQCGWTGLVNPITDAMSDVTESTD